ncbi:MAG TPA: zinc metallopeptidase [Luteolibacter sp.]
MLSFLQILAQYPYPTHSTGYMGISTMYWVIIGVSMLASLMVSGMLKRRFHQYSQEPMPVTGAQVAEMMLRQNGINDVRVVSVPGHLTDHYDPVSKTVNLSEPVYHEASVAAAAVAAHECGHAVQHQQAYAWLTFRSKMVPAVQLSSNLLNYLMIAGIFGLSVFRSPTLLWAWVALFSVTTLFAFITLPVEFDASRRALAWIDRSGLAATMQHRKAQNALFWAAMTYVVAALGSLAQLLYYVMLLMGQRRND